MMATPRPAASARLSDASGRVTKAQLKRVASAPLSSIAFASWNCATEVRLSIAAEASVTRPLNMPSIVDAASTGTSTVWPTNSGFCSTMLRSWARAWFEKTPA